MIPYVISVSYAATALAFLLATGLLAVSRAQHRYKALLLTACAATAAWAGAVVAGQLWPMNVFGILIIVLEQARSLTWMAAIGYVLFVAYQKRIDRGVGMVMGAATLLAVACVVGFTVYGVLGGTLAGGAVRLTFIARIIVAVVGLLLVENLLRNSGAEARWAVKYLCFGAGVIFVYDFYIYAEAALFDRIDARIYAARGFVDSIAAPLIILAAARSKSWPIDLHVSREMVFRSATLLAAGGYLVVMSAVGFSLRVFEGVWGTVAQTTFFTCAALLLAIVLSSGKVRARAKDFISRNFFSYKYDYRKEWLQFISAISDSSTDIAMHERTIRALANIVESTGGALWMNREGDEAYRAVVSFNMGPAQPAIPAGDAFIAALASRQGVVSVRTGEVDGAPPAVGVPQALREQGRAWLVLPLIHADELIGFVLLGAPRAQLRLTWEDFELLKTAGRQAASYIAEAEAAQSLAQARRFQDFNRQFAFVVHDIKNLAGQMSLMVKNAERHGDNPEFQKDMLKTVGHCAARMRALLEQIRHRNAVPPPSAKFDITARIGRIAAIWRLQVPALETRLPAESILIDGDPDKLDTVLNHLLQNALDAAGPDGGIGLALAIEGPRAVVTVSDRGPGMERAFVETKLFQPLATVKESGFGIGAFQTREIVRAMGGSLEVDSEVGCGTRMIVRLPLVAAVSSVEGEDAPRLKVSNG